MRTYSYLIGFFASVILFAGACESNPEHSISGGSLVSHSACKSDKTFMSDSDIPDTVSCVEYAYDASSKKLTLTHINAGFNCCPGELSCDISLLGDTIVVEEKEETPACDCNCLYDLEISVDNVAQANYVIKFVELYCGDADRLIFDIDLSNEITGSYCVNRNNYPWIVYE